MRTIFLVALFLVTTVSAEVEERLTEILSALVSMPTETADLEENQKALAWVEEQLAPLGLHMKRHTFDGHPSLVITTQDTMTPDLFLMAHIDVVPAPKALYTPVRRGNRLYGRGVYDMKMAIACYILLFRELKDQLPEMNIGLMITSDEEVGGMQGVKCLLEAGYSSQFAFLPDGGFNWNFEEGANGVLQVKIVARGISGHSSRPWLGDNAIDRLTEALRKVHSYFHQGKATANVGTIHGGKGINQVPDYAEAAIDIRYPPNRKGKQIYSDLAKLLEDPHLSLEVVAEGSPHQVDLEQPVFHLFREKARELYGIEVGKMFSYGASDARYFGERNIPVLVIAPSGGEIHSDGEWIDLEDLTRFYFILKSFVLAGVLL